MGYATSQQLTRYYELYQNIDVTFTKEVISTTRLIPSQIYIKALGGQWPCVINTTSMTGAKVIAGVKSGVYEKIQQGNTSVNLRFSFADPEKNEPISFFVSAKVTGINQYSGSPDLVLINLVYTQRAPDDLIEKLGQLLEANINSTKRREDRILITPDAIRKIGIVQKETVVFIQGIPRRCILRDLSFSGAKVIMVGIAQFLKEKDVVLRIDLEDPRTAVGIKGRIVRTEDVENRKDLVALAIQYLDGQVPMVYKMHINNFLSQQRAPARAGSPAADKTRADGADTARDDGEGKSAADTARNDEDKPAPAGQDQQAEEAPAAAESDSQQ